MSTPGDLQFHIRAARTDLYAEPAGRNPTGADAVAAVAIDVDTDPDFVGGSYVIVRKYLHDIDAWTALTVEQQEATIGRSKRSNIEKPDDEAAFRSAASVADRTAGARPAPTSSVAAPIRPSQSAC